MNGDLIKSTSQFSFKLDGENEIEASLLAETIGDVAKLTELATREENPDAYIKMNVTAFRNGSFQIDFSAVCDVARTMVDRLPELAVFALTVVGVVKGAFEIKKHLKGKPPKSVEETGNGENAIVNEDGVSITAPKSSSIVINNVHADQLVTNIANNIRAHNPSGGFSIAASSWESRFGAADVGNMAKPIPITETTTCQRWVIEEAKLIIKKPDVMGRSAWDFYFDGKIISARVGDDDWIERLHRREFTIGYNDMVTVTLEVYVDLDIAGLPVEGSEKYTVAKIFGGIDSPAEQASMFQGV